MKEREIIDSIKNRNENAAELFLKQYRPLIRYIAAAFLNNEQDIEECINDVVLKVFNKAETFDPSKGSWNAWITAIARNTALNVMRTYRNSANSAVDIEYQSLEQIPSAQSSPEEIIIKKEKQAAIARAVKELPHKDKIIFYRRYYYRQSVKQIASELGITERSAEGRLYRIRKKLQSTIGGEFND